MIKYNFNIVRDEGVEKVNIVPKLPTIMEPLVSIEGPNSIGKSTLLNMIALGCGGLKQSNLHPELKEKLRSLVEAKHQEVTFEIQIDVQDGQILFLEKQKGSGQEINIYLSVNGQKKPLSVDEFRKRFSLIYDIPQNPIGRVGELTKDLLYENNRLASKLRQLEIEVSTLLDDISHSRDPKRIKQVEGDVKQLHEQKEALEKSIVQLKEEYRQFQIYFFTKNYIDFGNDIASQQKKIKNLEGAVKDEKKKAKELDAEINKLAEIVKGRIFIIDELIAKLAPRLRKMFPKGKEILENWENGSDWKSALYNGDPNDGLATGIKFFTDEILEFNDDNSDPEKVAEAEFLDALIKTLDDFQSYKVVVPGINVNVKQFIAIIQEKLKECGNYAKVAKLCEAMINDMEEILAVRQEFLDKISPKIKAIKMIGKKVDLEADFKDNDTPYQEDILPELKRKLRELETKQKKYLQECIDLGIKERDIFETSKSYERASKEFKRFAGYNESECINILTDKSGSITHEIAMMSTNDAHIKQREVELRRLREKQPHIYQDYVSELNDLYEHITRLRQLVDIKCKGYLEEIIEGRKPSNNDSDRDIFLENLWRYLGRRIKKIRHGDKEYDVDKIDLTKKIVHVEGKRIIRLDDMGTGQQQAAYLTGLLSKQDSGKIIALLDEVAMMDSNSIKPIRETMRRLHKEGRLLIGIIVQRADDIKVTPL